MSIPPLTLSPTELNTVRLRRRPLFQRSDLFVVGLASLAGLLTNMVYTHFASEVTCPIASESLTPGLTSPGQSLVPGDLARQNPATVPGGAPETPTPDATALDESPRRLNLGPGQLPQNQLVTFQESVEEVPTDLFGQPVRPQPFPKTISLMGEEVPRTNSSPPLPIPTGLIPSVDQPPAPPRSPRGGELDVTFHETEPQFPDSHNSQLVSPGQTVISGELTGHVNSSHGATFRYPLQDNNREELLIVLTPLIVPKNEDSEQFIREEMQRASQSQRGTAQSPDRKPTPRDLSSDSVLPASTTRHPAPAVGSQANEMRSVTSPLRGIPTGLDETLVASSGDPADTSASPTEVLQGHGEVSKMKGFRNWRLFSWRRDPEATEDAVESGPALPDPETVPSAPLKIVRKPNIKIKPVAYQ